MKRYAWLLFALASCSSSDEPSYEPGPRGSWDDTDMKVDPRTAEPMKTHELGTDRLRPASKTIEWADVSTREGTTYQGGQIVVDRIRRQDADDQYGVEVRLGSKETQQPLKLEYWILFYDKNGVRLLGFHDDFRPIVIDPRDVETVADTCRVRGAVGFRLFLRTQGQKDEGLPDDMRTKPK